MGNELNMHGSARDSRTSRGIRLAERAVIALCIVLLAASWGRAGSSVADFFGCCNPSHIARFADGRFVTSERGIPRTGGDACRRATTCTDCQLLAHCRLPLARQQRAKKTRNPL